MFIYPEPEQRHSTQVPWLCTSILPEAQLLYALLTTGLIKFPEGFLFPATDDVRFPKPVPSRTSCAQLRLGVVCRQSARGMTSPLGQCSVLSSAVRPPLYSHREWATEFALGTSSCFTMRYYVFTVIGCLRL